jgi:hypothetical protein
MTLIVLAHRAAGESYFATLALSGVVTLTALAAVVAMASATSSAAFRRGISRRSRPARWRFVTRG